MKLKTEVSVVIPNWNGLKLLPDCLKSLHKQTYRKFEAIVVDNGSIDRSVSYLKRYHPDVKVIQLDKNYGFAKAVNFGISKAKGKYVALLNNDAKVQKDWLKFLVLRMKNTASCFAVSPLMVDPKSKRVVNAGDKINIVGQAFPIGYGEKQSKYQNPIFVFGASGGASLFDKKILLKIGLFDPSYFFYFEDVDLSLRANLAGFKAFFEPRSVVYHRFGTTAKIIGKNVEYWRFLHTIYLVIKNFPMELFFRRKRFFKIPLVWSHTFFFFVQGGLLLQALKVVGVLLLNLPRLLIARQKVLAKRRITVDEFDKLFEDKLIKIGKWRI